MRKSPQKIQLSSKSQDLILKLLEKGLSQEYIANLLNIHRSTITRFLKKINQKSIYHATKSPQKREELLQDPEIQDLITNLKLASLQNSIISYKTPDPLEVEQLIKQNIRLEEIAQKLGSSYSAINKIYKTIKNKLNLKERKSKFYKTPTPTIITEKICKICNKLQIIDNFYTCKKKSKNNFYYDSYCKGCRKMVGITTRKNLPKETIQDYNKKSKEYRIIRRKTDNSFKLREYVSQRIRSSLKKADISKNNQSFLKYVNWTPQELKEHIEKLFTHIDNLTLDGYSWMTWNNWGVYDPETWNDNDPMTWKWNLDHIIPHSEFPYISMEEDNFKKCWALENLRPYSAKLNILDGTRRVRHK